MLRQSYSFRGRTETGGGTSQGCLKPSSGYSAVRSFRGTPVGARLGAGGVWEPARLVPQPPQGTLFFAGAVRQFCNFFPEYIGELFILCNWNDAGLPFSW